MYNECLQYNDMTVNFDCIITKNCGNLRTAKCQSNSIGTAGIEIVELHDSNTNDDTNFIEQYRHDIKSRSVLSKKGNAKGESHDSDDYVEPKGKGKDWLSLHCYYLLG